MPNRFPKSLKGLNLLPGIQVRVVLTNGALANNGTGGVPYVLTGSLVAEIDDRFQVKNPSACSPVNVDVDVDNGSEFLLIDLGTTGITILVPSTTPTPLTLTGIIAINLNLVQIIAPVTPI